MTSFQFQLTLSDHTQDSRGFLVTPAIYSVHSTMKSCFPRSFTANKQQHRTTPPPNATLTAKYSEHGGVIWSGGRSCFVVWYWQTVCYGTFCQMEGGETSMWGVGGILHNAGCLTDVACGVNVWDGGASDSDDHFSHPHHLLQFLAVHLGAVSEPGSDAATQ